MIPAEKPDNEDVRLDSLRQLRLLDTLPEVQYDRITRVAQRVMGAPIALVSLVDEDRQWFLSNQGLKESETPRDVSFCAHALHAPEIFEVPDAALDERFADNPLVVGGPQIRFYAGCPIAAPDGSLIGTLCIIDTQPRKLTEVDNETLRDLAAILEQEIKLRGSATHDDLTGLMNRRGFYLSGQQALAQCGRRDLPALLLFADVVGLKSVNDSFGHAVGDELICSVAEIFREAFREADVIARIGGDEFAALLVDFDSESSLAIQRFQSGIAAASLDRGAQGLAVSAALGVASYHPRSGKTLEDLMRLADQDMYLDKLSRRESANPS